METKKTPMPEETKEMVKEPETETVSEKDRMQQELERLRKENEALKKNSVAASTPFGGKSDYERVQEACEAAAAAGKDAWTEKISIRAPRRPAKEDPWYWLSINGRTIQVPANDKYFELALPFAEALVNMITSEYRASDYIESIEDYDPITNPKKE
jgi:hypothetical protein